MGFLLSLVAAVALILCSDACRGDTIPEMSERPVVRIAGGLGGMVYTDIAELADSLSNHTELQLRAVPTEGSWDNTKRLVNGEVEFAIAQLDVVTKYSRDYLDGNLRAVAPLFTEYLHILVREPLELFDVSELSGKRIFIGAQRSGSAITAKVLMDLHGISSSQYERVHVSDLCDITRLLREDSLDIVMHVGAPGNKFVREILDSAGCQLFPLSRSTVNRITSGDRGDVIGRVAVGTIPANVYDGQLTPLSAVATAAILLMSPDIPGNVSRVVDTLVTTARDSVNRLSKQGSLAVEQSILRLPPKVVAVDQSRFASSSYLIRFWVNILSFAAVPLMALLFWKLFIWKKFSREIERFFRSRKILFLPIVLSFVCLLCALAIWGLEHSVNEYFEGPWETLWSMLIYITSGLENRVPVTPIGRGFAAAILAAGSVVIASLAGIFASVLIQNVLEKNMPSNLRDHYVILNWSNRNLAVIEQIHSPVLGASERSVVVVLSDDPKLNLDELHKRFRSGSSEETYEDVYFHPGDPCDNRSLLNANVQDAKAILIMADPNEGEVADEKTVRSLLALQKIAEEKNVKMNVVVELVNIENSSVVENIARHFPGVIDSVAGGRLRTLVLAHSAIIPGLSDFYRDLLRFGGDTNELYLVKIPVEATGLEFSEYAALVLRNHSRRPIIPVGLHRVVNSQSFLMTNPESSEDGSENPFCKLCEEDELLVLSYDSPQTEELPVPDRG